jgi:hypothetical protein
MRYTTLAFLLAASCWSANLAAAPLEFKQVAADAKWLAHVDFDAMRDSIVVKKAVAKHEEKHKKAEAHLKMVEAMIGMNPKQDLHGATFYGKVIGKHVGVMILHAKMDQGKVSAWALAIPGREGSEHNGHKISTWTKEHHGKKHTMSSAWFGEEHLVIASSVEEIAAALDVLDGKAGSIGEEGPLAGPVPAGTTLMMRVSGIDEADLKHKDPVAKQTKSFRFVLGEKDGESFFRSRSVMTNPEIVDSLKEVVEGGKALAKIHFAANEQATMLVGGLEIIPDESTLTLTWKGPAEAVWTQLELQSEKMKAHFAKMREHHKKHHGHDHKGCDKCNHSKEGCEHCKKDDKGCEKCKDGDKCEKGEGKSEPKSDKEDI